MLLLLLLLLLLLPLLLLYQHLWVEIMNAITLPSTTTSRFYISFFYSQLTYMHVYVTYSYIILFIYHLLYYSTAFIYYFGCVLKMHFKVTESYSCLPKTVLLLLSVHLYFHINLNRSLLSVDWNNSLSICWSNIFVSMSRSLYYLRNYVFISSTSIAVHTSVSRQPVH